MSEPTFASYLEQFTGDTRVIVSELAPGTYKGFIAALSEWVVVKIDDGENPTYAILRDWAYPATLVIYPEMHLLTIVDDRDFAIWNPEAVDCEITFHSDTIFRDAIEKSLPVRRIRVRVGDEVYDYSD